MTDRVLRPADCRDQPLPERPAVVPREPEISEDWIQDYDRTSASTVKIKYDQDPEYAKLVDLLLAKRSSGG